MVHYAKDLPAKLMHNVREGNGTLEAVNLFTKGELEGRARVCDVFTFDPGDSIGYHEHIGEAELYYILTGTATVTDGGKDYVLKAGDAHYCPDGSGHCVINSGDDVMKMLAIVFLNK